MSERKLPEGVYAERANEVQIVFKDKSGEAERFVYGKTLDEVLEQYGLSLYVPGPTKSHQKRTRRTKAEIAAAQDQAPQPEDVPPAHRKEKNEPAWPA